MQFGRRQPLEIPNAPHRAARRNDERWRSAGPGGKEHWKCGSIGANQLRCRYRQLIRIVISCTTLAWRVAREHSRVHCICEVSQSQVMQELGGVQCFDYHMDTAIQQGVSTWYGLLLNCNSTWCACGISPQRCKNRKTRKKQVRISAPCKHNPEGRSCISCACTLHLCRKHGFCYSLQVC
jgi:hypothetical protein